MHSRKFFERHSQLALVFQEFRKRSIMSKKLSKEKRGESLNPSQGNTNPARPNQEQNEGAAEGSYRNVETSVNNPDYYDDEKVTRMEDELTEEEPRTEKEGRTDRS